MYKALCLSYLALVLLCLEVDDSRFNMTTLFKVFLVSGSLPTPSFSFVFVPGGLRDKPVSMQKWKAVRYKGKKER